MNSRKKNQANVQAKEGIVSALMELLQKKKLSAISVSELTQKAGVSRMTYYRNYQSKEDIFVSYLADAIDAYREDSRYLVQNTNYYDKENLIHCFTYFKKYNGFLNVLFQSGYGHFFLQTITDYVLETWQKPGDSIEHYYALQAFSGALYNLYISWAMNGSKESPEKMAELLYQAIP